MKKKIEKIYSIFLIVFIYFVCIGIIVYNIFINPNELTHIEKVIKKHNSVKQSISNPKYPTIEKPVSSQSTVIYGDSVRVMPKIYKQINEDSLNNDPETLDWFIDERELYIYTKQDSIDDEIERNNYIKNLK